MFLTDIGNRDMPQIPLLKFSRVGEGASTIYKNIILVLDARRSYLLCFYEW